MSLIIDPFGFAVASFGCLLVYALYLVLPRGLRKQYFGALPRRHAWSNSNSNSNSVGSRGGTVQSIINTTQSMQSHSTTNNNSSYLKQPHHHQQHHQHQHQQPQEEVTFEPQNDEIVVSAAMQQVSHVSCICRSRGRVAAVLPAV
jgi:hypothetical protein